MQISLDREEIVEILQKHVESLGLKVIEVTHHECHVAEFEVEKAEKPLTFTQPHIGIRQPDVGKTDQYPWGGQKIWCGTSDAKAQLNAEPVGIPKEPGIVPLPRS